MKILYKLPILYILSNNKKRFWKIWINEDNNKIYICREYGIIGGKITIPQEKIINHIGTITPLQKAITEVNSLWRRKKESGFQEENNILANIVKSKTSKIKPMGAHKLDEHYHKIKYPALVQRKLDGFRCLSNVDKTNNIVNLYSKNMKPFIFLNHIKKEILKIKELIDSNIYLDGELYNDTLKLHEISSLVMKKYATKEDENNMKNISFYIFDMFDIQHLNETFEERYKKLKNIFKKYTFQYLKLVECTEVSSYENIKKLDIQFLYEGYEGVIVRNKDGIYQLNSKSYDVLRTKEFKKKEFQIIDAKAGTGTQNGSVIWKLQCFNNKNKTFWAIQLGKINDRIKIYQDFITNPKKYIYKKAIVKYLDIDKDGCIIRNPIVINILL